MRITGGRARGRLVAGPAGLESRPTSAKVRQAFFNIVSNKVPGARFLDLFAGTGLIGLEALSRGAGELIAVEENRKLARSIEQNLKRLGFEAEVICADVRKVMPVLEGDLFDIIFADPPYKSTLGMTVLRGVDRCGLLRSDGVLAIEHAVSVVMPEQEGCLTRYDQRRYGQTVISFYCCQEDYRLSAR